MTCFDKLLGGVINAVTEQITWVYPQICSSTITLRSFISQPAGVWETRTGESCSRRPCGTLLNHLLCDFLDAWTCGSMTDREEQEWKIQNSVTEGIWKGKQGFALIEQLILKKSMLILLFYPVSLLKNAVSYLWKTQLFFAHSFSKMAWH